MGKSSKKRQAQREARETISVVCLECAAMWSVKKADYRWCPKCDSCRVVRESEIVIKKVG